MASKFCLLFYRLDDGELSDDESTDTASDIDTDDSLPVSAAVLSDLSDKRETLHKIDRDTNDRVTSSGNGLDVESVKTKLPVETTSMPTVRLERLSVETSKQGSGTAPQVIQMQTPVAEHNYFSTSEPPPVDDRRESRTSWESHASRPMVDSDNSVDVVNTEPPAPAPTLPPSIAVDHCYCVPFLPSEDVLLPSPVVARGAQAPQRKTKRRLSDVTNVPGSRELSSILPPASVPPPRPRYQPRDLKSEIMTLLEFILGGVDAEDIMFLRRRYEQLLQFDSTATDWLNDTHWVDHPPTFFIDPLPQPPPRKRRKVDVLEDQSVHVTGQSIANYMRTSGYYFLNHLASKEGIVLLTGLKKINFFLFKSDFLFFQRKCIFVFLSLYYAVKHHMYSQDCGKSLEYCELHVTLVSEPVTVKSVVEELIKLNKRIKQYICFCLL